MQTNKRLIGEQNRNSILVFLNRFGWLTLPMISKLVWPTASQSLSLARRALQRLIDEKRVIKRKITNSLDCFTLSSSGASYLSLKLGIPAESGARLKLSNAIHRACGNWYLIEKINNGHEVWTEYEIQTGRAPIKTVNHKTPDGLINSEYGYIWIEVENSWKNIIEREKIINFLDESLKTKNGLMTEIEKNFYICRAVIIGTRIEPLRGIRNLFKEKYISGEISESTIYDIEVVYSPMHENLYPENCISGNLWYDGVLPFLDN